MPFISVVIPVYKCSSTLPELAQRLSAVLSGINDSFEIIFVNDASPENDWDIISGLSAEDQKIKGINLSRNFGQHIAITAGLHFARGEWIVVMDGDLQDVPEEIPKIYEKAMEGFDLVIAQRQRRQDHFFKRLFSRWFYKIFAFLTDTRQDGSIANFGIYNRQVIEAILSMKDAIRYFPAMVQWVGFKSARIPVVHGSRPQGKSAYNMRRLYRLAFNNIIAFSDKPLRLTVRFGFLISLITFIIAIVYLVKYLQGGIDVTGFTTLILSIWFFSGMIIMILGIVGLYVGKAFDKIKDRPIFIVKDKLNLK